MSWLSRLIGSSKAEKTSLDIVSEYGAVMEHSKRGISGLMDASDLPFDKAMIRSAILEAAAELRDSPSQIEALGAGFVMLGSFQNLSQSPMQMPSVQEVEAMDEVQFKQHIEDMMSRKDGDSVDRKVAMKESADLLAEWQAHLDSLGVARA